MMYLEDIPRPDVREVLRPDYEVLIAELGGVEVQLEGLDRLHLPRHTVLRYLSACHSLKVFFFSIYLQK